MAKLDHYRRHHLYELESAQGNLARSERLIEEQQERMRRLAQIGGRITPASEHLLTLLKTSREAHEHYILLIERELERGE
jgi:3-methyladenine DNA glycosylase AlkC